MKKISTLFDLTMIITKDVCLILTIDFQFANAWFTDTLAKMWKLNANGQQNTWEYVIIKHFESKWTHVKGKYVEYSDNLKISFTRGNYKSNVLSIFFINRNHYGEYQFGVSDVSSKNRLRIFNTISFLVASIRASQKVDTVNYIYAPVGSALVLDYHIDYLLQNEVLDWEYKTESKFTREHH